MDGAVMGSPLSPIVVNPYGDVRERSINSPENSQGTSSDRVIKCLMLGA